MKKINIITVVSILLICFINLKSQTINIDSLLIQAEKSKNNLGKLVLYNVIEGNCEFNDILKYCDKTVELSDNLLKKIPEKKDSILHYKSIALNDIGYYYKELGKTSKAVDYFLMGIKIQESINDSNEFVIGYNNIATILKEQGDTTSALTYYEKAESLCKKFKNLKVLCHVQNQIGLTYRQKGDYAKALSYYENSLVLARSLNDKKQIAKTLNFIGSVNTRQKNFNKATQFFEEALNIFESINDYGGQSTSLMFLASINKNELKDLKKAEKQYLLALEYATKSHNLSNRQNILQALGVLYHSLKINDKAFSYYYNYTTLKDTIQNDELKRSVLKKEMQYSFDKKFAEDSIKHTEEQKVKDAIIKANISELNQEKTQRFALYTGIVFNLFKASQKQKEIIELKNKETESQNIIIEEKQKEILDSIHYAKRIQNALLASKTILNENLNGHTNYFVFYNPKDIVSGDFYWATEHNNKFYLAVCDCTGHGVPGAFMSLLNIGFLSEAIKEKNIEKPNEVFNYVRTRLVDSISNDGQQDGMDGILLCVDKTLNQISYAAANNEPVIVSNNNILELPKDKMPVGKGEKGDSFNLYTINANKGDTLYLYTDGYADQFGGPKGKKFKYKALNNLLLAHVNEPMARQKEHLNNAIEQWRGNLEQVDDILIIGLKI
jgi:serine phosphatase RsbU (regulator of sigma subunit)/tetratricopeptide (TPR) repeat protein